ncbi:MAG: winged helix-turn-helix domain-containing protein [Nitrososphaerales archaeon]
MEIYASLLENAARENTKVIGITKLMYTSSHSYGPTSLYLEVLRRQWLLDYDDSVKLYKITPKGRQFLELYNKMAKLLELVS